MKKFFLTPIVLFIGIILFSFTEKDSSEKLNAFHTNFNNEYENLATDYAQSNNDLTNVDDLNVSFYTAPIIKNGIVTGRFIDFGNDNSIFIDFSKYTESITIYDVKSPDKFVILDTRYDSETDSYVVDDTAPVFWCEATCTAVALAIAAADGPSPAMDIIALAYQVACVADCQD